MLSLKAKLVIALLTILSQIIGIFAGLASWYRDCLNVSKLTGYFIVFMPLLVAIFIWWSGALSEDAGDIVYWTWLVVSLASIIAAFRQITFQCKPRCNYKIIS